MFAESRNQWFFIRSKSLKTKWFFYNIPNDLSGAIIFCSYITPGYEFSVVVFRQIHYLPNHFRECP
jgi:hypothetical protein